MARPVSTKVTSGLINADRPVTPDMPVEPWMRQLENRIWKRSTAKPQKLDIS